MGLIERFSFKNSVVANQQYPYFNYEPCRSNKYPSLMGVFPRSPHRVWVNRRSDGGIKKRQVKTPASRG